MDEDSQRNLESLPVQSPNNQSSLSEDLHEQHVTSLPLQGAFVVDGKSNLITLMFHWTVRFKVIEMNKRKAAILLKVLMYDFLAHGLDLSGYIAAEFLVHYIMGGKLDPLEIYDERDRQAALLGNLILASIRGTWMSLDERIKLPPTVIQGILDSGWMPDKRTWSSWKQFYNVRSFIEILTVPLEQYNEREIDTSRYNSYTKGYGNGGHISRVQKTPIDPEIDGESTDRDPPVFRLQEIDTYNQLLLLVEKAKSQRTFGSEK